MSEGIEQIVYPVTDLAKAKTLYSELSGVSLQGVGSSATTSISSISSLVSPR
jgi:hypothetical protein